MEPKPIVELHTFWASYWWTVTTLDTSIRSNYLQSVHLEHIRPLVYDPSGAGTGEPMLYKKIVWKGDVT